MLAVPLKLPLIGNCALILPPSKMKGPFAKSRPKRRSRARLGVACKFPLRVNFAKPASKPPEVFANCNVSLTEEL